MVRKKSEFPCLSSNSHLCHTRVIYFLFYPSARLRCMDSSHGGQHCCCHHFDFCCPHKVSAEQDSGKHLMEQMCLRKQKHNSGSHKPSLGEEKCLCDLETRQVHVKDMWSIPCAVASLSSHHPMSIAACHTPYTFQSLSQHLKLRSWPASS